jgi:hypothetical protein
LSTRVIWGSSSTTRIRGLSGIVNKGGPLDRVPFIGQQFA